MKKSRLSRRTVLRGLGGFCVALPFLELFQARNASAAEAPKRYVVAFGGISTGKSARDFVVPTAEGPLPNNLSQGLAPLADYEVDDVTSIVSGLKIPWGATPPAGGRDIGWHASSPCPMLSGMRSNINTERIQGETSDWIVAKAIGGPTLSTRPVLAYRVQAAYYRGTNGTGGTRGLISVRDNNGKLEQSTPQFSPQIAYQDMFSGFIPPDPEEAKKAIRLLNHRKSVIDLVSTDTERLLKLVGAADKQRMERHFDELRALEKRLEQIKTPNGTSCKILPDPGADPPVGGAVDGGDKNGYAANGAWSDEELRATIMVDLIHMAFACDLSRVSALMFTYSQSFLNTYPLFGLPTNFHELGHGGVTGGDAGAKAMADAVAWHVKHIARLTKKLRDTTDVDGSTVLDNTAIALTFEGGWGYDPQQNNEGVAHSSENMVVLLAGLAGGLNKSGGQHLRRADSHPAQVLNTAMKAVGVNQQLGEVSGTIDGLIG
jgi:hypothetical protein